MQDSASDLENRRYRAKISGIGDVEFLTSDRLPLTEPRKLVFVHPWIRDICDPHDGFTWASTADDSDSDSDPETEPGSTPTSPLDAQPTAPMDNYTRALRLVVRLQQPFHALLLQQQPHGEFKRVAAKYEIVIPGIKRLDNFARDVHTGVVEIL
ncbi:hypothetical protein EV363DRAFT_1155979 [Boletus edulis]|nr:hypothetical protein EV363DRAFT_1155979 [Boletus edulis]